MKVIFREGRLETAKFWSTWKLSPNTRGCSIPLSCEFYIYIEIIWCGFFFFFLGGGLGWRRGSMSILLPGNDVIFKHFCQFSLTFYIKFRCIFMHCCLFSCYYHLFTVMGYIQLFNMLCYKSYVSMDPSRWNEAIYDKF